MPHTPTNKAKKGGLHYDFKQSAKKAAKRKAKKAKARAASKVTGLCAGSAAHKAQRWKEYKGTWDYARWEKMYELNMVRAKTANKAVDTYHKKLGWGKREVTVQIKGESRRLDIADKKSTPKRGVEHKTGYITLSEDIRWEVERDAELVKQGWDIEWHFEGTASKPLLRALKKAGISVSFKK